MEKSQKKLTHKQRTIKTQNLDITLSIKKEAKEKSVQSIPNEIKAFCIKDSVTVKGNYPIRNEYFMMKKLHDRESKEYYESDKSVMNE